jgi:hypothetical protein
LSRRALTIAVIALLLVAALSGSAPARETLCGDDEQTAFSCHVGEKLVSLCASSDLSKRRGWVQYRFGKPDHLELAYPKAKQHPRKFLIHGVIPFAGGGADYYRFTSHGYRFVVYSGFGRGWVQEGVVVEKAGTRVASHVCRDGALGPGNWKLMYSAGVPEDDATQYDFRMP